MMFLKGWRERYTTVGEIFVLLYQKLDKNYNSINFEILKIGQILAELEENL